MKLPKHGQMPTRTSKQVFTKVLLLNLTKRFCLSF
ncbi:hypothetical protein MGSAQ_002241 [marine sediment metagenome]|uniref:Uncharacterized protein n=1 Tax=marine sediment metagenome TaxID=412755 RepID=A0A1B6NSB0_9ZZZZ